MGMLINKERYGEILEELRSKNVLLVAVSKTKTIEAIQELYDLGQRDFGENYVQEMTDKYHQLPKDVRWHFIGHLQTNKVRYIAPYVYLIHSVDSLKLLKEINKQGQKNNRLLNVLLQIHIAQEETKFGLNEGELNLIISEFDPSKNQDKMEHTKITGMMGMASFTENKEQVRKEFRYLKSLFDKYAQLPTTNCQLHTLSMGMSNDYKIAVEEGSNLVRIGSLIFGERT